MDFWVGEWDLSWEGGSGRNSIVRTLGGCVIEERFTDHAPGGLVGRSHSVRVARAGQWRQTWVDDKGGYIALAGGPQADGSFVLEAVRPSPAAPELRMVFADIRPAALTWRWQKKEADGRWVDQWVIRYARRGAPAPAP